jgi:hypothetical protein
MIIGGICWFRQNTLLFLANSFYRRPKRWVFLRLVDLGCLGAIETSLWTSVLCVLVKILFVGAMCEDEAMSRLVTLEPFD